MEKDAPKTMEKAKAVFKGMKDSLISLYGRWQDEKEYEDFKDYSKVMENKVTTLGGKFLKASKRPFGCTYLLENDKYQLLINGRTVGWKYIG